MKKIILSIIIIGSFFVTKAQYIVPVEISTDPQNVEIAIFGAATVDGGTASFLESFSSKGDIGFVINALVRRKEGSWGVKKTYKQFIVNLNPVIIDWSSFDLNTITKTSIDSFSTQRMPFAEDCLLQIGVRHNSIAKLKQGGPDQFLMHSFWVDLFYRPYSFASIINPGTNLGFQTFNVMAGYQYNFFKTNVPVVETFLFGLSPQICFMGVNEGQYDQNALKEVYGTINKYAGQNFMGFGAKLTVQIKHLNIFIDGRQYFAVDKQYTGMKFSEEPIIVVGAFGNLKFYTKAPNGTSDDIEDKGWE
jgi:hypothetical protein